MFLDTSGLFCYLHADEAHSQASQDLFESSGRKLTHSYVIAELVALSLARGVPRPATLDFVDTLVDHPQVHVVWVTSGENEEAMRLLRSRQDKGYSLCDAVSFVLMRRDGIIQALTTDRHFEQEGFERLLK